MPILYLAKMTTDPVALESVGRSVRLAEEALALLEERAGERRNLGGRSDVQEVMRVAESVLGALGALRALSELSATREFSGEAGAEFFFRETELRRRLGTLASCAPTNGDADGPMQRASVEAVERLAWRSANAIVAELGDPPASDRACRRLQSRLDDSLYLRQRWAYLRWQVSRALRQAEADQRLLYAAAALAEFFEVRSLQLMRSADRQVLIELRDRLRRDLVAEAAEEGQRTLSDLETAVHLLSAINRREELLLRDQSMACTLLQELPLDSESRFRVAEEFCGLDADLDQQIFGDGAIDEQHLVRLRSLLLPSSNGLKMLVAVGD